ncbi:primosomal protein DnaI [Bombilactobacillus bombi]|uniref:primosomal protein DnaI n=1 Tax=Bombilactobacillus bombi TaxID=1303590 RepID=UPI0015E5F795|nr:primosomal protein DnaI [Bombilactobacillus bombi]MBA1434567.1 primosomal protein DnaI [Bombilactobacillus bombi]
MKDLSQEFSQTLAKRHWGKKYQELTQQALHDKDVQTFIQQNQTKITQPMLDNGVDAIYEFVQAKNNRKNFAIGYVPQLMVANQAIQVTYHPDKQLLSRQQQVQLAQKFMTIDMASDIRQANLRDYEQGDQGRQESYLAAVDFTIKYGSNPQEFVPGLYLSGELGVGKTYLLAAIAQTLVKMNTTVLLVHFPTFAVQMKAAIQDNSVLARIDKIKAVPILMLDDIGADSLSSWIRDEVLGVILQYRMQEKLPTFFSSNLSMDKLEKHLAINQRGDEEALKAARIMERIRFLSREVVVSGPNRRFK